MPGLDDTEEVMDDITRYQSEVLNIFLSAYIDAV